MEEVEVVSIQIYSQKMPENAMTVATRNRTFVNEAMRTIEILSELHEDLVSMEEAVICADGGSCDLSGDAIDLYDKIQLVIGKIGEGLNESQSLEWMISIVEAEVELHDQAFGLIEASMKFIGEVLRDPSIENRDAWAYTKSMGFASRCWQRRWRKSWRM